MKKNFTKILFLVLVAGFLLPVFSFASTEIVIKGVNFLTGTDDIIYDLGSKNFSLDNLTITNCSGGLPLTKINVRGWEIGCDGSLSFGSYYAGGQIKANSDSSAESPATADIVLSGYYVGGGQSTFVSITSISGILDYAGQLFTDLQIFIWLAIGLPVGFMIINKAIDLITKRTKK